MFTTATHRDDVDFDAMTAPVDIPGYTYRDGRYFRTVRSHERAYLAPETTAATTNRAADDVDVDEDESSVTIRRPHVAALALDFSRCAPFASHRAKVLARELSRAALVEAFAGITLAGRARAVNALPTAPAAFAREEAWQTKFMHVEPFRARDGSRMMAIVRNSVASLNEVREDGFGATTLVAASPAPASGPASGRPMPACKAIGDGSDGLICANWCGVGGERGGISFQAYGDVSNSCTFVSAMDCVEDVCRAGFNVDDVYCSGSHGVARVIESNGSSYASSYASPSKRTRMDAMSSQSYRAETVLHKNVLKSDVFAIDVDEWTPKVLTLGTRSGKIVEFDMRVGKGIEACTQVAHLTQENIYQVKKLPPHRASGILFSSSAGRYRVDPRTRRVETIATKRNSFSRTAMGFADDFFSSKMGFCDEFFSYAVGKNVFSRDYGELKVPLVHSIKLHPIVRSSDFAERNIAIGCEIDDRGEPNIWALNENGFARFSNVDKETPLTQVGVDDEWCIPFLSQ